MVQSSLRRLQQRLSVPHRLIGLAFLRICFGFVTLINLVSHLGEYRFLWGTNGMMPYAEFVATTHLRHSFSLFALSPRPVVHALIYACDILVTILFLLGWKTRWVAPLFAIFNWSLDERNFFLLDGGDNLLYLLAFWLMFTDCGARFSLDAGERPMKAANPYLALIHNTALFAMVVQVMVLYGCSAMAKVSGTLWQNGTAIYYVLRTGEFNLSPWTPYLWKSAVVVTLLTYSTMIFQVLWPILIWNRRCKLFMALGALTLHSSIGYFMGLTWFSMVMIGAEVIMFSDREFEGYRDALISLARSARRRLASQRQAGKSGQLTDVVGTEVTLAS
jgi:hypothetical protein